MKKCRICKNKNQDNQHYCKYCGNNLSNQIELSDILFFINSLLKIVSIIFIIMIFLGSSLVNTLLTLSNDKTIETWPYYLISISIFLIGHLIKRYAIKRCKNNIHL